MKPGNHQDQYFVLNGANSCRGVNLLKDESKVLSQYEPLFIHKERFFKMDRSLSLIKERIGNGKSYIWCK